MLGITRPNPGLSIAILKLMELRLIKGSVGVK